MLEEAQVSSPHPAQIEKRTGKPTIIGGIHKGGIPMKVEDEGQS